MCGGECAENMANEAERGERRSGLVPRVARGCQPQDNNFIIGGITPARRSTVPSVYHGVGGSADIVSIRTYDRGDLRTGCIPRDGAVGEIWPHNHRIIISTLEIPRVRVATAEL